MKEQTLSDRERHIEGYGNIVYSEDVKEFIKKLKEKIPKTIWGTNEHNRIEAHEEIDNIFGKELTK